MTVLDSDSEDKKPSTASASTSNQHRTRDRLMAADVPPSYAASTAAGSSSGRTDYTAAYSLATTAGTASSSAGPEAPGPAGDGLNMQVLKDVAAAQADVAVDVPDQDPPDFTPYQHATYTISGSGSITSFDKHLNQDAEALAKFLIMHLLSPPQVAVRVVGAHEEVRSEVVTHRDKDGRIRQEFRDHRTTVTDFDLSLPITAPEAWAESNLADPAGKLYIVTDDEVVGRGGRRPQRAELSSGQDLCLIREDHVPRMGGGGKQDKVDVRWRQRNEAAKTAARVAREGLPPFLPSWLTLWSSTEGTAGLPAPFCNQPIAAVNRLHASLIHGPRAYIDRESTQEGPERYRNKHAEAQIRRWAEEYVNDRHTGKMFHAKKLVYGWNWDQITCGLGNIIRSAGYPHDVDVTLSVSSDEITVRPANPINAILYAHWSLKVLLTLLLFIYPFVWLFDAFSRREYDVVRCAFPLRRMVRWMRPSEDDDSTGVAPPGFSDPGRSHTFCIRGGDIFLPQGDDEDTWLSSQTLGLQAAVRASANRGPFRRGPDRITARSWSSGV